MSIEPSTEIALESGVLAIQVRSAIQPLEELCDFAARENPKRGFLFVSKVLGKHIPVKPSVMRQTHQQLAQQIKASENAKVLCIALAETATCLGAGVFHEFQAVYSAVDSYFMATTRYQCQPNIALHFQEEHSHATEHLLHLPEDPEIFSNRTTLVLVDDEMSTGKTLQNLLRELRPLLPKLQNVVMCSITNWMSEDAYQRIVSEFADLEFSFPSLLNGSFEFTPNPDFKVECPAENVTTQIPETLQLCNESRIGYRHDTAMYNDVTTYINDLCNNNQYSREPVLVLGTGEFAYQPFLLALELESRGFQVYFQTTTRSPILIGDAIHEKTEFVDNYGQNIPNYVYNVPSKEYQQIFVCHETSQHVDIFADTFLTPVLVLTFS